MDGRRPTPGAEPLVTAAVAELRSRGVTVAALSNRWVSTPLIPTPVSGSTSTVVIFHHVGLRKPDPEIFAPVLQWLDLPGERCVFVDDVARYLPLPRRVVANSSGNVADGARAPSTTSVGSTSRDDIERRHEVAVERTQPAETQRGTADESARLALSQRRSLRHHFHSRHYLTSPQAGAAFVPTLSNNCHHTTSMLHGGRSSRIE
ncbi:MAG: HAD-IA family hydrolase [Pseudonocardiaceae bacterium]